MQALALVLTLMVGGIAAAALIGAGGQRRTVSAADPQGDLPRQSTLVRGLAAAIIGAAVLLEVGGLWISLRAYKKDAPAAVDVLVMVGAVLLFASVTYFVYLWTLHRFAQRRKWPAGHR